MKNMTVASTLITLSRWYKRLGSYPNITRILGSKGRYFHSQVASPLKFLSKKVVPFFPALLTISIFSINKNTEETKETQEMETEEADLVKQADELYNLKNKKESNEVDAVKNLYEFLVKHKDCNNAEIQWRLARAKRELAKLSVTDNASKKTLTYEAHEVAKKALEIDNENFACHKWYAITLSDVGDYEGTKQKISNAYNIQKHFKQAIDLNPLDATCYHLYGRWCLTVADVPWYQRQIASAIFDTPPSSSFEEAIEYFERGERLEPNFYSMNHLMIAKSYLKLGKKVEARQWLEKLSKFDCITEEDVNAVTEGTELLKSC